MAIGQSDASENNWARYTLHRPTRQSLFGGKNGIFSKIHPGVYFSTLGI
jgi:hypothetical protein